MPAPSRYVLSGTARLLATAAGSLALSITLACGGSDGPTQPEPPGNGSMTATVNGTAWNATLVNAISSNGFVSLYGRAQDNSEMAFAVETAAPGTFTIPVSTGLNFNYIEFATGHQWQALAMGALGGLGNGTLTITTLTTSRVAGTFSYQAPAIDRTGATGSATITSGKFDIEF
ncbi:MAG TPA: DUF6252 family protein [Gemmatimonadales bacterium]|nr:DUF6252 family protein [Gemmatimonadales bacterium]